MCPSGVILWDSHPRNLRCQHPPALGGGSIMKKPKWLPRWGVLSRLPCPPNTGVHVHGRNSWEQARCTCVEVENFLSV